LRLPEPAGLLKVRIVLLIVVLLTSIVLLPKSVLLDGLLVLARLGLVVSLIELVFWLVVTAILQVLVFFLQTVRKAGISSAGVPLALVVGALAGCEAAGVLPHSCRSLQTAQRE
jgi:hypothetical protein